MITKRRQADCEVLKVAERSGLCSASFLLEMRGIDTGVVRQAGTFVWVQLWILRVVQQAAYGVAGEEVIEVLEVFPESQTNQIQDKSNKNKKITFHKF